MVYIDSVLNMHSEDLLSCADLVCEVWTNATKQRFILLFHPLCLVNARIYNQDNSSPWHMVVAQKKDIKLTLSKCTPRN